MMPLPISWRRRCEEAVAGLAPSALKVREQWFMRSGVSRAHSRHPWHPCRPKDELRPSPRSPFHCTLSPRACDTLPTSCHPLQQCHTSQQGRIRVANRLISPGLAFSLLYLLCFTQLHSARPSTTMRSAVAFLLCTLLGIRKQRLCATRCSLAPAVQAMSSPWILRKVQVSLLLIKVTGLTSAQTPASTCTYKGTETASRA